MAIKLTKVEIGSPRYVTYDGGEPLEVSAQALMVVDMEGNIIYNYDKWSQKIGFVTPTKDLSDKQYATQENGFHWVKIPGYKMIKIKPEMIDSKGLLNAEGQNYIETNSEAE